MFKNITRRITTKLLTTCLTLLLPIAVAMAQGNDLQSQTQQGERGSRAITQSLFFVAPLQNGIKRIRAKLGAFSKQSTTTPPSTLTLPTLVPPDCPYTPGMKTIGLQKAFPGAVTWHVCVTDMGLKGLWVGPVYLKRTSSEPWMWVLYQAGLADIFVPYHNSVTTPDPPWPNTGRVYDMRFTSMLDQVTVSDAGINGGLITLQNETVPTVVAEIRERGVGWLCKQDPNQPRATWRAQEFVVWGVSDAGNYDNIIEYGFRDDGGMTFRLGNTGYNQQRQPNEAHTHNGLWRVDMDLNGAANNSAVWFQHIEPALPDQPGLAPLADDLQATDSESAFPAKVGFGGGVEGAQRWNDTPAPFLPQYTSLLIEDGAKNAWGHHLAYEFKPLQAGTSRHYGAAQFFTEAWTLNDVYVTVYHPAELDWTHTWTSPDNYLLKYLTNERVTNNDLVVWINASAHHDPTDEDKSVNDAPGSGTTTGVTLVHWSGFEVEPHNLFDTNPLGGPVKCGN
jgi:primary-amine oxidase